MYKHYIYTPIHLSFTGAIAQKYLCWIDMGLGLFAFTKPKSKNTKKWTFAPQSSPSSYIFFLLFVWFLLSNHLKQVTTDQSIKLFDQITNFTG